jgi:hypothetical protein
VPLRHKKPSVKPAGQTAGSDGTAPFFYPSALQIHHYPGALTHALPGSSRVRVERLPGRK